MKIFATTLLAFATVVSGNHHRHTKFVDPVVPELSERERTALSKFQNHDAFKHAWAVAGKRLHERLEQLREKSRSHLHHRKHRVLEDD